MQSTDKKFTQSVLYEEDTDQEKFVLYFYFQFSYQKYFLDQVIFV